MPRMLYSVARAAPNAKSVGAFFSGFFSSDFFPFGFFSSGFFSFDFFSSGFFSSGFFSFGFFAFDSFSSSSDFFRSFFVRSNDSLAMKVAPHQLEAGPLGLIGVLNTPIAVWSLVKA